MARARYDEFADWYPEWVGEAAGLIAESGLLPRVEGVRVLDVACGHGRVARALARLGAQVVGVDISSELIALARERDDGIDYRVADIADVDSWWDGVPFDGAVCELAMMDIDDMPGVVRAVATTVRAEGWFIISMVHPCFPGNEAGLSSWPPDATYFREGRWTSDAHNPVGVRSRVGSSHRTLSTYLNALIDSGFAIDHVVEPPEAVPTYLLLRCRRTT